MAGTLSRCFRCGSSAIEARDVEELVRRGPYVAALKLRADVCTVCGERYLDGDDVSTIERVRQRLERGEHAGWQHSLEVLERGTPHVGVFSGEGARDDAHGLSLKSESEKVEHMFPDPVLVATPTELPLGECKSPGEGRGKFRVVVCE